METNTIIFAFLLTLFAGLSTGFGSLIALLTHKTNVKFLSISLGFSAGVMIYISFTEILVKAKDILILEMGMFSGNWIAVSAFFSGMLLIALIDKFVPSGENPHEIHKVEEMEGFNQNKQTDKLYRMGILSALAIAIHNFPEGLATFTAALSDTQIGIPIAIAIAIHNIPEGIAVSIPVFFATGNRYKAFKLSFISGLAEPMGALIGYLILMPFMSQLIFGILFAAVAGIMVFISLDELLPAAREYGEHHYSIYGLLAGMAVMAISLLFFL